MNENTITVKTVPKPARPVEIRRGEFYEYDGRFYIGIRKCGGTVSLVNLHTGLECDLAAFRPAGLQEVDGILEIVPGDQ